MAEEALSQDAIDQLLRDMASGKGPAPDVVTEMTKEAPAPKRSVKSQRNTAIPTPEHSIPRRIRDYDFRRPNRISKEYMRGLRLIHDAFCREIPRVWGPLLRSGGQVKIISMEQTIYDEYRNHLPPHCFICTATMPPLEGEIAVQIDLESSFIIIDRLLGGPGTGLKHTRELTSLELSILQRIIVAMLPTWREAWLPIIHLEPEVGRLLPSTEFLQLTSLNESVLVTTFQARFLNTDIEMTVCIPYTMIVPIISRVVMSETFAGQSGGDESDHERLNRRMRAVSLELSARLGAAPVPIAELSQLSIGDVIRLDVPASDPLATIHISNRPYFVARPGLSNGNLAVQVSEIIHRKE